VSNESLSKENVLILQKAKSGDINAFEKLIALYQEKIYNLAHYLTGNEPDARDLTQDALLKIFTNLKDFNENSSFFTWAWRIVNNLFVDKCRLTYTKTSFQTVSIDSILPLKDNNKQPEQEAENNILQNQIEQALLEIPIDFRITVILSDIEGFSYEDISEITKVSLGTVKSRINRGRKFLKEILEKKGTFI